MESFSTIRITEKAPGAKMLPVLFWYLKVCRAVLIAIHSEFCYSIFIKNHVYRKQHRKDKMMYLIAGLGNPTREYDKTRHNVGFSVIDVLADKYNRHY